MKKEWQRPQTTRRYIHPPKAERMFTLWKEGKIIFGEINEPIRANCYGIVSRGMWLTYGKAEQADFHTAQNILREDGIPIHGLKNNFGGLDVEIETFASFERFTTCYIKAVVKNSTEKAQKFGVLVRTATEGTLVKNFPDVYASYAPEISVWKEQPVTFTYDGKELRDGEYYLSAPDMEWNPELGHAFVTLEPGAEKTLFFAFGKGEAVAYDYEAEKQKTIAAWELEIAKITKLPESIKANPEIKKTIQHLTVQMLQCFCTSVGTNRLYPRQGGLQRQIWTGEAWMMIEAMCQIGDFRDYLDPVMELYFNEFQTESGEMVPFGISWAMATATVLFTFAKYAESVGQEMWDKYRDQAYRAFCWMRDFRVKESYVDEKGNLVLQGLFPPRRACDDELIFQGWGSTDANNLVGLETYLKAAERFGDPAVSEIQAEYDDYLKVMQGYFDEAIKETPDHAAGELCYSLTAPNRIVTNIYHFSISCGRILETTKAQWTDVEKVLDYYTKAGTIKGGLYWHMKDRISESEGELQGSTRFNYDENGKSMVWYVCCEEYSWFKIFMRFGKREKAEEVLRDNFRFAMTDEYYMLERYNQQDPYFGPWMPNASANGRTINMLMDFYR